MAHEAAARAALHSSAFARPCTNAGGHLFSTTKIQMLMDRDVLLCSPFSWNGLRNNLSRAQARGYLAVNVLQPLQTQVGDNTGCPIVHRENVHLEVLRCCCHNLTEVQRDGCYFGRQSLGHRISSLAPLALFGLKSWGGCTMECGIREPF